MNLFRPTQEPINNNTDELAELSRDCWVFIGIAIAIFVIATAIILYMYFSNRKKTRLLQELSKNSTEEEIEMLSQYRSLSDEDKAIVNDTVKSLSNNHNRTN